MRHHTIALFGEAERGTFQRAYECDSVQQLVDYLGHPPAHTCGIPMAIQALMYERRLIFFRVAEEGYSLDDYYRGLRHLDQGDLANCLVALAIPGVGNPELLAASHEVCRHHHSVLLTTEGDLYDYLTCLPGE